METIVVGMSGGVDSAVAALLLKEQGYDVVGLFMHNWEEENERQSGCSAADDWEDARLTAAHIGIPIYSVNFAGEYLDRVFKHFIKEYEAGRTPNPDVLCNREIKFDAFLRYAEHLGSKLATGHYCASKKVDGKTWLLKAADSSKDQTYFLNQVQDGQLDNVVFPLGDKLKSEVRRIADSAGLSAVAKKKDSTGICFIGERKFKEFLKNYIPARSGKIVDTSGAVIGTHDGLMYYTLGQRRGLGIGGKAGYDANRWYVIGKDLERNELTVSCGEGEELLSSSLIAEKINYIGGEIKDASFRCCAKIRYRQSDRPCTVYQSESGVRVEFDSPERAVTPGQYLVLYDGDRCLGGSVIL